MAERREEVQKELETQTHIEKDIEVKRESLCLLIILSCDKNKTLIKSIKSELLANIGPL